MHRRTLMKTSLGATLALILGQSLGAMDMDKTTKESFDTVMAFMGAMGEGDMETVDKLMADDMTWHNEGDPSLPWIGETIGKENIFKFLGVFSQNVETTLWQNEDAFASGDTVAVFGKMKVKLTKSDVETNEFTFALRAKVRDGQVVLWNWFEDSFAVSQAYHGKA